MIPAKRSIKVHTVPQSSALSRDRQFSSLIEECSGQQRPRIVLDCSRIGEMNIPMIQQLLSYLEDAMRCNGDVRLAGLRSELAAELHRVGVSRLFELYPTTDMAVQSFYSRTSSMAPLSHAAQNFETEYAA